MSEEEQTDERREWRDSLARAAWDADEAYLCGVYPGAKPVPWDRVIGDSVEHGRFVAIAAAVEAAVVKAITVHCEAKQSASLADDQVLQAAAFGLALGVVGRGEWKVVPHE